MSIVSAKNFTFIYPGSDESVLNEVSLEIEDGEVIGIVGPVGAGKTTLCRAIAGLIPSISGGDAWGEINVSNQKHQQREVSPENHRKVGMVFEDYAAQLIQLKVLEEVKTPLLNRGLSPQEAENRARELLDKVGLGGQDMEKKPIWALSGGQQQRLAIAATLAIEPEIIILDNVMDKLDPKGQEQVQSIVAELNGHKTQVIVDRDPNLLLQKTQRLLIFVDGKVIAEGAPEEILRNEELLARADIEPPICLRVARALEMSESPLTPEELQRHLAFRSMRLFKSPPEQEEGDAQATLQPQGNFGAPTVCVENVTFSYSNEGPNVLEGFNLTLREGEIHALIGRSGVGKTTVVKHITGLVKPDEGKVTICDTNTRETTVPELGLIVGTVFQNPDDQISERTVKDEIAFPLKQRQYERNGWFSKQERYDDGYIEERVSHVCELVEIQEDLLNEDPFLLPQGQQKLVTIAAALVVDPKILLLDEPTIGLGATAHRKIKQTLENLREQGKAVLLVSNNVDFVAEIADTVTVLEQGQIVLQGSVRQVFAEDNWEQLSRLYIHPPQAAQLARRFHIKALTCNELVSQLSSKLKEA